MSNISCNTYRKFYFKNTSYPIAKEVWDTEEYHQWVTHPNECKKCNDWNLKQELKKLSISLRGFPCVHLAYFSSIRCKQHTTPYECPDVLILKFDKFNEYSLKMGNTDSVIIQYCPWCGKHLPQSKRQKWFKEVEALGFEPGDKRIPKKYDSSAWYTKRAKS